MCGVLKMKKEKFDTNEYWKQYKSFVEYLNRCEFKRFDVWIVLGSLRDIEDTFIKLFKPKAGDGISGQ